MNIITSISSPNYSTRNSSVNFIIIHYTELNFETALHTLCDPLSKVSSHYLIKADGTIFELVDAMYVAWHSGQSHWKGLDKINDYSIGIELDNLGYESFSTIQMNSCINLCKMLLSIHNISNTNILSHSDIAVDRKIDPGIFFDWSLLASHNLGMWHNINITSPCASTIFKFGDCGKEVLSLQKNLKKIGYKIELTSIFDQQTNYVIRSFQSHFYPKSIERFGIDFYQDNNSKYRWDKTSNEILYHLIALYFLEN